MRQAQRGKVRLGWSLGSDWVAVAVGVWGLELGSCSSSEGDPRSMVTIFDLDFSVSCLTCIVFEDVLELLPPVVPPPR